MPTSDRELPETLEILDLVARLVASVSDRLDAQGEVLDDLAQVQGQLHAQAHAAQARRQADPDHVAATVSAATTEAIREALLPELRRIEDSLDELGGGKHLRRSLMGGRGRRPRWRTHPWAIILGIPLALGLLLAALMPSAMAQTPLSCRTTGGTWLNATADYPASCLFEAHGQRHQPTGETS